MPTSRFFENKLIASPAEFTRLKGEEVRDIVESYYLTHKTAILMSLLIRKYTNSFKAMGTTPTEIFRHIERAGHIKILITKSGIRYLAPHASASTHKTILNRLELRERHNKVMRKTRKVAKNVPID